MLNFCFFAQVPESSGLPQLLVSLQRAITWMLDMLEGLPEREQAEYLDVSGSYQRPK